MQLDEEYQIRQNFGIPRLQRSTAQMTENEPSQTPVPHTTYVLSRMRFVHRWRRDAALPLSKKASVNRSTKHVHCVDDERTIVLEFHQKERKLNSQLKRRNTIKLKDLSQLRLPTGYQS